MSRNAVTRCLVSGVFLAPLLLLSALVPSPPPAHAAGTLSFAAPATYPIAGGPGDGIAIADFDGDTVPDLAVIGGPNPGMVTLYHGNGDGTFGAGVPYLVAQGNLMDLIAADVNNDGFPDLVATSESTGSVFVALNNGDGTFNMGTGYAVGSRPMTVTAADFNGDAWTDLAVSNHGSNTMSVLLNNGDGTFGSATNYGGGNYPGGITSADLNGDGFIDLAMVNYNPFGTGYVGVYLNDGRGTFTGAGAFTTGGSYSSHLVVGDFNEDGIPDVATANTFSHNVSLLFGDGTGALSAPVIYRGNTYPHVGAAADFDGDTHLDVAWANNGTNYFTVHRNLGNGTFADPQSFPTGGTNVRALAVGDLDGDGRPDVVTANASSGTISVLINTTAP